MGMCEPRRIGILGGTFDPIHIGHLRGAIEVVEAYKLDKLLLIPNAIPPHNTSTATDANHRLEMVSLAVKDIDYLAVDCRELERNSPSWTIDTLISLRNEHAAGEHLIFIVGMDSFCSLPSWYRWRELLNYCNFLVLQRDSNNKLPSELQGLVDLHGLAAGQNFTEPCGQISFMQQNHLPVSSTQLRQMLINKQDIRFLVPDIVFKYIKQQKLYTD